MIRTALISVYDKTGVEEFARGLVRHGVTVVSTGNTYRRLKEAGVPVTYISDLTGFPEILGGRVKTLHPAVHGGILARRDVEGDMEELSRQGIGPIDLVAVNLYPFAETIARPGVTHAEAVENIDIGGPAMIRAAAKNHQDVLVIVDPARYGEVIRRLDEKTAFDPKYREELAYEAFAHTAAYDRAIEGYFAGRLAAKTGELAGSARVDEAGGVARAAAEDGNVFPDRILFEAVDRSALRYGENPHQKGAFYRDPTYRGASIATARQLHGMEMSYCNIMDAAAALEVVREFDRPAAVAVKHANPCGLAVADTLQEAFSRAYEADPVSIFGGIVALNRPVDAATAQKLSQVFLHVILAPSFEPDALAMLTQKKNLRLLELGPIGPPEPYTDMRRIPGGLLVQEADLLGAPDRAACRVVTRRAPTDEEWRDLAFAWIAVKHVKSNAIVVAVNETTIGVGAGQMNRIQAARLALEQAGERAAGAVLASDAFFPFPDVVEEAAKAGITAIIQPGGAKLDQESIDKADEAGIAMLFTGIRHFKH